MGLGIAVIVLLEAIYVTFTVVEGWNHFIWINLFVQLISVVLLFDALIRIYKVMKYIPQCEISILTLITLFFAFCAFQVVEIVGLIWDLDKTN